MHCVNTPAHAVRRDAEKILSTRLAGYRWTCIPYVKTGAKLAISVMNKWIPGCNVVVPGNHVLVVVGETVMEEVELPGSVVSALAMQSAVKLAVDMSALEMHGGRGMARAFGKFSNTPNCP